MLLRLRRFACLMLVFVSATVHPAGAEVTFLIVERPAMLILYDQYQQNLDEHARQALPPFLPMRLVSSNELLGDGLTPCMKVEIQGSTYFILRESPERLVGASKAGHIWRESPATSFGDTVEVIRGGRIGFESLSDGQSQMLPAGERLTRVFSSGGRTYVERQTSSVYGWVTLNGRETGNIWKAITPEPRAREPLAISSLQDSVRSRIANVNRILSELFDHFNTSMHVQRVPPRWTIRLEGESIVCTLEATKTPEDFSESTAILARAFGSMVLGTRFKVVTQSGSIAIRPG